MNAILNTTFVVAPDIEEQVLDWIRNSYAQSANKQLTSEPLLMHVLGSEGVSDPAAKSYALQMQFNTIEDARRWNDGVAAALRRIMAGRWGEKALSFHTYLSPL